MDRLKEASGKLLNKQYRLADKSTKSGKLALCWTQFSVVIDEESGKDQGIVSCKKCGKLLIHNQSKNGTTSLNRHMRESCPSLRVSNEDTNASVDVPSTSSQARRRGVTYRKVLDNSIKNQVLEQCVDFVARDLRPFETLAGKGFVSLAQSIVDIGAEHGRVDVSSILPHPTTVSRRIYDRANALRESYLSEVIAALDCSECCFQTDMWTDDFRKRAYVGLNIQYLKDWEIKNRLLYIAAFPEEKKTGEYIKQEITKNLSTLRIPHRTWKDAPFVTDQGSNMIKALEGHKRYNCVLHLINTVLRNTFNDKYLKDKLPDVKNLLEGCSNIVAYMKRSGLLSKLSRTLNQDVEIRWNSKFLMLQSVVSQLDDIRQILEEKKEGHRIHSINESHLRELTKFLEDFYDATVALEGGKCVTLHIVMPWIDTLIKICSATKYTDSDFIVQLKERAKMFLIEKCKILVEHKIATFLSPTHRKLRAMSEEDRNAIHAEVRKLLASDFTVATEGSLAPKKNASDSVESQPTIKRSKLEEWEDTPIYVGPVVDEITMYLNMSPQE